MGKKTYEECLDMVKRCGDWLRYVPDQMQTDRVIDAAMEKSAWAFMWINDESKKTLERCLRAVKGYWFLLGFVPVEMQTDEMIDEAMRKSPCAISYIKDESKKTLERCVKAVRYRYRLLEYVPKKMHDMVINEYEEWLEMVKRDGLFLRFVPEEMQTDEMIDEAMRKNPLAFQWIRDESKKTLERCLRAVRGDNNLIDDVPEDIRKMVRRNLGYD